MLFNQNVIQTKTFMDINLQKPHVIEALCNMWDEPKTTSILGTLIDSNEELYNT